MEAGISTARISHGGGPQTRAGAAMRGRASSAWASAGRAPAVPTQFRVGSVGGVRGSGGALHLSRPQHTDWRMARLDATSRGRDTRGRGPTPCGVRFVGRGGRAVCRESTQQSMSANADWPGAHLLGSCDRAGGRDGGRGLGSAECARGRESRQVAAASDRRVAQSAAARLDRDLVLTYQFSAPARLISCAATCQLCSKSCAGRGRSICTLPAPHRTPSSAARRHRNDALPRGRFVARLPSRRHPAAAARRAALGDDKATLERQTKVPTAARCVSQRCRA